MDKSEEKTNISCGLNADGLRSGLIELNEKYKSESACARRARLIAFALENARITLRHGDGFAYKADFGRTIEDIRWGDVGLKLDKGVCADEFKKREEHLKLCDFIGGLDFGHSMPDFRALLKLGVGGLIKRLEKRKKDCRDEKRFAFYDTSMLALGAFGAFVRRFAALARMNGDEPLASRLTRVSDEPPTSFHEALQLIMLYYVAVQQAEGCAVRSLGGLDELYPYYAADIAEGRESREDYAEVIAEFYRDLDSFHATANVPFFIGGQTADGKTAVNPLSYELVRVYLETGLYDPKIHVRVTRDFPDDLMNTILDGIRRGSSSFVFVSDDAVIKGLTKTLGESAEDARDYTVIGCYEPAAYGKEMPSSCCGLINVPKSLEIALGHGFDIKFGVRADDLEYPSVYKSFDELYSALKLRLRYAAEQAMEITAAYEKHYDLVTSAPLTSATFADCVEKGEDAYTGGAKYNNSGLNVTGLATAVDSLMAIKRLVLDERRVTLGEFTEILKNDWRGADELRLNATQSDCYGNGHEAVDALYTDLYDYIGGLFNGKRNGRNGLFRMGAFSIDNCFWLGKGTAASADGRRCGEPISKNSCASVGKDKSGVTALLSSVAKADAALAPNGGVLDVVLHPSAVSGDDGLNAFAALVRTYFALGGFAVHFNVFSSEELKKAKQCPEKYSTLQVRVCGWNAYFVDLPPEQQDTFIKIAEGTE